MACGCSSHSASATPSSVEALRVTYNDVKYNVKVDKPISFVSTLFGPMIVSSEASLFESDVAALIKHKVIDLSNVEESALLKARHPELVPVLA